MRKFPMEFAKLLMDDQFGYFGVTMPVISVKPCHSKRSYNFVR